VGARGAQLLTQGADRLEIGDPAVERLALQLGTMAIDGAGNDLTSLGNGKIGERTLHVIATLLHPPFESF
jgi:hypothetical protein